jgi:hypothetical protein
MANPTTNYGFVLPTPTDLVTDLPADFDVALQGVDTRLKALQPGTTLGDLAYSSATANTNTRLGIGSTGNVLTVTGGVPVWAAPATGGGMTSIASGTLSGSSVSLTSIPSTYNQILLTMEAVNTTTDDVYIGITLNSDTGATAYQRVFAITGAQTSGSGNASFRVFKTDNAVLTNYTNLSFPNYNSTSTYKAIICYAFGANATTTTTIDYFNQASGWWANTANAISSIQIAPESGTFEGGSYTLWGIK